jgi:hypothetical protein
LPKTGLVDMTAGLIISGRPTLKAGESNPAMLSSDEIKSRIKAIDLLSGLLNNWSAKLFAREKNNRPIDDSRIILIRDSNEVSGQLLGSVVAVSKMVAETTGSDIDMGGNFVAFLNKSDLTSADLKFRAERVALKLTELRTSYVNYLPGHPGEVTGLLERMQSLHSDIATFITKDLPRINPPNEVLRTTLSRLNEILYNFIHTTATKQTALIVLDDLRLKLDWLYGGFPVSDSKSASLKTIKDKTIELINSIQVIVMGAHAPLLEVLGHPVNKMSFEHIKFWSGSQSSDPFQWMTTTSADSQEIYAQLQRTGFINAEGLVKPMLTDTTAEEDLKLAPKFTTAAGSILDILHVAKKSLQDAAMNTGPMLLLKPGEGRPTFNKIETDRLLFSDEFWFYGTPQRARAIYFTAGAYGDSYTLEVLENVFLPKANIKAGSDLHPVEAAINAIVSRMKNLNDLTAVNANDAAMISRPILVLNPLIPRDKQFLDQMTALENARKLLLNAKVKESDLGEFKELTGRAIIKLKESGLPTEDVEKKFTTLQQSSHALDVFFWQVMFKMDLYTETKYTEMRGLLNQDKAMLNKRIIAADNAQTDFTRGGIDLNTSNGMLWKVSKDGQGVVMTIDPNMLARIKEQGIDSLSPVIFKITPIASIWPMVGLKAPVQVGQPAGI